jgi:hypothetical protein
VHAPDNGGTDEPAITRNFTKTRVPMGEIRPYVRNLGHALPGKPLQFSEAEPDLTEGGFTADQETYHQRTLRMELQSADSQSLVAVLGRALECCLAKNSRMRSWRSATEEE